MTNVTGPAFHRRIWDIPGLWVVAWEERCWEHKGPCVHRKP